MTNTLAIVTLLYIDMWLVNTISDGQASCIGAKPFQGPVFKT